jgi:hypothetical protein
MLVMKFKRYISYNPVAGDDPNQEANLWLAVTGRSKAMCVCKSNFAYALSSHEMVVGQHDGL